MTDLEELLEEYFEAVEAGKFPDYATIKTMLRSLKSARDDNRLYDEFKNRYRDSCQLLDQVYKTHGWLANKDNRGPIEKKRRNDMKKNPDWYQYNSVNASKDEIKMTEFISAVEVAQFLLVKVGCSHKGFKNFLNLDEKAVFGFAKLICAFTGDFKILEMYLRFADEQRFEKLMSDMIEYLCEINSDRERSNPTERENFEQMILEFNVDKKAKETIDYAFETFVGDFTLAGRMKKSFGSMIFTRLVCENLDEFGKRTNTKLLDLPRFAKNVDGQPFILHMIAETVKKGIDGMVKQSEHESQRKIFENSKKALALSVPILEYVIKTGFLEKFKPSRLRDQVDSILEDDKDRNAYMKSFEKDDSSGYKKLIKLLEHVRSLDNTEKDIPAKVNTSKKPDDVMGATSSKSKYEPRPSSNQKSAKSSSVCVLV